MTRTPLISAGDVQASTTMDTADHLLASVDGVLRRVDVDETAEWLSTGGYLPLSAAIYSFPTRAAMLVWKAAGETAPTGSIATDGTVAYVKIPAGHVLFGTDPIPDLPGWMWFGVAYPDHFKENTTPGTTDMGSAILASIALAPTRLKAAIYATSVPIVVTDGMSLVGVQAFWKRRTAYVYTDKLVSVIKYTGTTGANSVALRVSETAVGTVGSDFAGPDTDDLVSVTVRDFHVDAGGADYGAYVYRAGNQASIGNITAEGAARANHVHLGCYAAEFGTFGAYESEDVGAIIGYDEFGWGSVESTNFAYTAKFLTANNGTGAAFVEGTATDLDGAGALIVVGRGSHVSIVSEGNAGRAFYAEPYSIGGGVGALTIITAEYIEANGTGAKLVQPSDDGGLIIQNGFIHPGNGGSLAAQDFDIEAQNSGGTATDDEGPDEPSQWIVLRNLHGGFDVDSNTDRYRVEGCGLDTTFTDRRPTVTDGDFRSEAVNGDFSIWQRGTGGFTSNGYTADRWYLDLSGATGTVTREILSPAALPGYEAPSPDYFLQLDVTAGNANAGVQQRLADVEKYSNRRLIFSFWAKSDTLKSYRVDVIQNFGSGGSADVTTVADDVSVNTGWRRFTVACDVPSVSGKTIGADSYVSIRIRRTAADTFTLGLAAFAIEANDFGAGLYRQRSKGAELDDCQTYFQRLVDGTDSRMGAAGQAIGTTTTIYGLQYPERMRKTPTLAVSSVGHFATSSSTGADLTLTGLSLSQASDQSCRLVGTVASGLTAGNATSIKSTSASATFDLNAEV
jgi:hypothetical protein